MPAFQSTEEASLQTARLGGHELLEHLRVPPLGGWHPRASGLGLLHVRVLVHFLLRRDSGENQVPTELPPDSDGPSAAPGRPPRPGRRPGLPPAPPPRP